MAKFGSRGASLGLGFLTLFVPLLVVAQPASLVRDINTTADGFDPGGAGSFGNLRVAGNHLFFVGNGEGSGGEIWVSDGTPTGTDILRDLCPGECNSFSGFQGSLGGVMLLSQQLGVGQHQLWRSDGTQPGTYALTGSGFSVRRPEAGAGRASAFFRGAYYFVVCTDSPFSGDCDLWRTDGSGAGTRQFHSLSTTFLWVQEAGGRLFYLVANGAADDLWVTDGTESGTRLLHTFAEQQSGPNSTLAAGGRIFFFATSSGEELWTSDGTSAGTQALTQLAPQNPFPIPYWLKPVGDRVYFTADDGSHGREIWRSDGTKAGTVRLTDFSTAEPFLGDSPASIAGLGSSIVFVASGGGDPFQLWVNRGTVASTTPLALNCPNCSFARGGVLVESGSKAFFQVRNDSGSEELWVTDGTAAGSRRVTNLCADGSCSFLDLQPWKGGLLFLAQLDIGQQQVWFTDGTPGGTKRFVAPAGEKVSYDHFELAELGGTTFFFANVGKRAGLWVREANGGSRPVRTVASRPPAADPFLQGGVGDHLLFTAQENSIDDFGFWLSGGSEATTFRVDTGSALPSFNSRAVSAGGLRYFQTGDFSRPPTNLWRTDGTAQGTFVVAHLQGPSVMAPWQGGLTFFDGGWIWKTNGTVAGTVKTGELPLELLSVEQAVPGPNGLYLKTDTAPGASQMWISDGSTGGTRQLTSFSPNGISGWDPEFTAVGSTVFFSWLDGLWKTDGTAAGTVRIQTLPNSELPIELVALHGALIYVTAGFSSEVGVHLWRTDGTAAGTVQLATFPSQNVFTGLPLRLVPFDGKAFVTIDDGAHGIELWATDGTPAGTALAFDLVPGPGSSRPIHLTVAGGRLYFSAGDTRHGQELWQTDGTLASTRLVQDIAPQAGSSTPSQLTVVGDKLYFAADDGATGRELWVLPLAGPSACMPSPRRLCLGGGRYTVEAAWQDFEQNRGAGHAAPLTADTGYFWFFDPANVEVVLKVLDGRGVNDHVWVFYGALSSVEYTLTVTDTQTGLSHRYRNPSGQLASVGDTHAFGPLGASTGSVTTTSAPAAGSAPLQVVARRVVPRAATGACAPSTTRLCLSGSRFSVEVAWKDFAGNTGAGKAVGLTADTGWFWFFDPANVELVLKVLDGSAVNGHRWVFYGALSSVEYTVTVTDTQTGEVSTYRNPSGQLASVADIEAL
jgi:ELWxxDGT repeat protein